MCHVVPECLPPPLSSLPFTIFTPPAGMAPHRCTIDTRTAAPRATLTRCRNAAPTAPARRCLADWFAGLVPIYLAARYRPGGMYLGARCVLLIHNLRHQGVYSPSTFELLGLPGDWYGALEWQYPPEQRMGAYEEEGRAINTLKGAIGTADRIIAVSPGAPRFSVSAPYRRPPRASAETSIHAATSVICSRCSTADPPAVPFPMHAPVHASCSTAPRRESPARCALHDDCGCHA